MKIKVLFLCTILCSTNLFAQSPSRKVSAVQYFFNSDPGVGSAGNGAIIQLIPTANFDSSFAITIPATLDQGLNNLYVRAMDDSGRWGLAERSTFLVQSNQSKSKITACQYFFDADLGLGIAGNGSIIQVNPTINFDSLIAITIPSTLITGLHNLYIRVLNDSGIWSVAERGTFLVQTFTSALNITAYQYYFDSDPGMGITGNGAVINVSPTDNLEEKFAVVIPNSLNEGLHNFYFRVKDSLERWSTAERSTFLVQAFTSALNITAYQFYFDSDPGVGIAGNGAVVNVSPTDNLEEKFAVVIPNSLSEGLHNLYFRVKDSLERWSIAERSTFLVQAFTSDLKITTYQYYFDSDPGVGIAGNGALVNVSPTTNFNQSVTVVIPNSLSYGLHNLYIRAKDEYGRWSIIQRSTFLIQAIPAVNIDALEYYFENDPGVGNGVGIPIARTTNFDSTVAVAVNCFSTGIHRIYLRAKDTSGVWSIIERGTFTIGAICQNITVQLDNTGNGSTTANEVNSGSNSACGIASMVLTKTTFTCANVGPNNVTLTVTDTSNTTSKCTATITVKDQIAPIALCNNLTIQLNSAGIATTNSTAVNNGSSDNCGIGTINLSQTSFVCSEVGNNSEVLTVTDVNGNTATCSTTIVVKDEVAPIALCKNVTVQLDNTGNGSTSTSTVNNGSTDACGIATLTLSQTAFVCAEVGNNAEVLTVTDANGNSSTCSTTITLKDQVSPIAVCKNVTVQLDNAGVGLTSASAVNNSSSDACGIATLSLSQTSFVCSEVGNNAEVLTVTDNNGNTSTCATNITVRDQVAPTAICKNITIQLDNSGNATTNATAVNNGSNDACGIATLSLSQTSFVCSEVGNNAEVLTVTDNNGNTSTCATNITVRDQVAPTAICKNITIQLDNSGNATTNATAVNNGSNDACGIATLSLSQTSFVCSEVGNNAEVLTVTDVNNNTSTCTTTIAVQDKVAPTAICKNVTVQLDNSGNGTTNAAAVNNGSNDACGIATTTLSQTSFVCSEVGNNAEVLTVTDNNGNSSTCATTITVRDQVAPTAICKNITIQLDNSGNGTTNAAAVNNGSTDACGIATATLSQTSFVCSEVGNNSEVLTVTDNYSNTSTCATTITVRDQVNPTAICKDITIQLDNSGNGTTNAAAVNNGSNDACGIATTTLSQTSFVCSEVGNNSEVLTVSDNNNNTSTCATTITVKDEIAPIALCKHITILLDNTGNLTIPASSVNNGSNDSCGIATLSLSQTSFVCSEVGNNSEVLTVTDNNSNTSTCATTITVQDKVAPTTICKDITIQLDNSGNGTTNAAAVNNGSTDACGIATTTLSQTSFVCSEVGNNSEVLTVTDVNNNSSTCATTITVQDKVAPTAICNDITIQLDNSGIGTTNAAAVNNGSNDACGIATTTLSQTSFVCSEVGNNSEVLTVTDNNANSSTCATTITVQDKVAPTAICKDITIQLDNNGNGTTNAAALNNGSNDACGIATLSLSQTAFVCAEVGNNTEVLTVTDVNGNSSTCSAIINVKDQVAPLARCKNVTIRLDINRNALTSTSSINNVSTDACGIATLTLSRTSFGCNEVGNNTEVLTVTDVNGNSSTCSATITVLAPELNVLGNGISISDGTTLASGSNHTDFGSVARSVNIIRTFTIRNTAASDLHLANGSLTMTGKDNAHFSFGGINLPLTILPDSSANFNVTFIPSVAGVRTAKIHIANNDCDESDFDFAIKAEVICEVIVYPNPTRSDIKIAVVPDCIGNSSITLINVLGVEVAEATAFDGQVYTFNVDGLASAVYFVKLSVNGKTEVHRVVIAK